MAKHNNKIERIEDLLAISNENVTILEEEIDLGTQQRYFVVTKRLTQNKESYRLLCDKYASNKDDLFLPDLDLKIKKSMLVILGTIADIDIYRTIEKVCKIDGELQKWAIIALQQCRMSLQNELLERPSLFISSGLGGKGKLLRYFCVFFHKNIHDFQRKLLDKELRITLSNVKGELEDLYFAPLYTHVTILVPIQMNLPEKFQELVDECNLYGDFIFKNVLVTNTKRLSEGEITSIIAKISNETVN